MKPPPRPAVWPAALVAALAFCVTLPAVHASEFHVEAMLVWGSNDPESPNPKHKPVPGDVADRLKGLPFKWSNYYEVNRKPLVVSGGTPTKVQLSRDCAIEVRRVGDDKVEVTLHGKGQVVGKVTQPLPRGETLLLGGNAAGFTSWFVVLKQIAPKTPTGANP